MLRHTRLRPYVRRYKSSDKTDDFRMAIRLACYIAIGKPFYVMVQRGVQGRVVECGPSKESVKKSPVPVSAGWYSFNEWAKMSQSRCMGIGDV